jgi:DNA-binding NarL/FixJ family response regulator
MSKMPIRIIIVDDHPLVREGLRFLLAKESDLVILGEAADVNEAKHLIRTQQPDVVLLDISLPGKSGIAFSAELQSHPDSPKILFISMHEQPEFVSQAFHAGAHGYVLKSSDSEEVANAIREVSMGHQYVSSKLKSVLEEFQGSDIQSGPVLVLELSDRESEVLRLVSQGLSAKEVAESLGISHRTVETHRMNIMKKLGAKNVAELIKIAVSAGILS